MGWRHVDRERGRTTRGAGGGAASAPPRLDRPGHRVARRGGVLALCEVKARSDPAALVEPVTAAQRARIRRAAEAFVASRPDLAALQPRLDVLTVRLGRIRARVRHQPGAAGGP